MSIKELQDRYSTLFSAVNSIINTIESDWGKYPSYLGWQDLLSPIVFQPDILFIGINPGPGRFIEKNCHEINKDGKKKCVLKDKSDWVLPPSFSTPWRSKVDWFRSNVAKENGQWWEHGKKQKNFFPKTMCDVLTHIYPKRDTVSWEDYTEIIENRIVVTNVFPFATYNLNGLKKVICSYNKYSGDNLANFFNHQMYKLVELIKPRCIVFLGKTAHSYCTFLNDLTIPYITIDRRRGWHSKNNISKIATSIRHLVNSDNV